MHRYHFLTELYFEITSTYKIEGQRHALKIRGGFNWSRSARDMKNYSIIALMILMDTA